MARNHYKSTSFYDYLQYTSFPIHLIFFLSTLFLFFGFAWYINYESMFEAFMNKLKLLLTIVPVVLLLLVHWLSSEDRARVPFVISLPDKDSFHRAGGSSWGVGILLVFLLFMVSYQASLHESWFPLLTRR